MSNTESLVEGYVTRAELAKELGRMVRPDGKPLSARTIYNYENSIPGLPFTCVGKVHIYRIPKVRAWFEEISSQRNVR